MRGPSMAVTLYRDVPGKWRWRLWNRNGKIMADSGQGYVRRIDCLRAAHHLFDPNDDIRFIDLANDYHPRKAAR